MELDHNSLVCPGVYFGSLLNFLISIKWEVASPNVIHSALYQRIYLDIVPFEHCPLDPDPVLLDRVSRARPREKRVWKNRQRPLNVANFPKLTNHNFPGIFLLFHGRHWKPLYRKPKWEHRLEHPLLKWLFDPGTDLVGQLVDPVGWNSGDCVWLDLLAIDGVP